jgi:hypothetical protein
MFNVRTHTYTHTHTHTHPHSRQVLVIFFGDSQFNWQFKDTLDPFEEYKERRTGE